MAVSIWYIPGKAAMHMLVQYNADGSKAYSMQACYCGILQVRNSKQRRNKQRIAWQKRASMHGVVCFVCTTFKLR